jgi:hypothetical protein
MNALHLRPGREEAGLLSDLALRSKGHWGDDPLLEVPIAGAQEW